MLAKIIELLDRHKAINSEKNGENMTIIDDIVPRYKAANPVWSFFTGFHEYDGVPPDYDNGRIAARAEEIKADMAALEAQGEPEEKIAKFNHNPVESSAVCIDLFVPLAPTEMALLFSQRLVLAGQVLNPLRE